MTEKKGIYKELYEYMDRDSMVNERNPARLEANTVAIMLQKFENDPADIRSAYMGEYFMQPDNMVIHWGNTHLWHLVKELKEEVKNLKDKVEELSK